MKWKIKMYKVIWMGSSDGKKIFQVKKGSFIFGKLNKSTHDFSIKKNNRQVFRSASFLIRYFICKCKPDTLTLRSALKSTLQSVHPYLLSFCWGDWASNQIFEKGGLTRSQFWEGVAGKEGVTFFKGESCSFFIKSKLKS